MRLLLLSDTHGRHKKLKNLPEADVLVVTGDITPAGELEHLGSFVHWLEKQPFERKIVIAGNHDWCFQSSYRSLARDTISAACDYLEDSEIIVDGLKFYGSPWQPEFCNWAFNLPRGVELANVWAKIPDDTDVLLTHGPPYDILDKVDGNNEPLGCEELAKAVLERIKPKLHVFGHIHSGNGLVKIGETTFVNASVLDEAYKVTYPPIIIDI